MLVVPQTGNVDLMEIIRAEWVANKPTLHVYKNDYSPTLLSTIPDFVESDFDGYAPVTLDFANPAVDATDHVYIQAATATFNMTGNGNLPQRAFGIYVLDSTGLVLLFAERFPRRLWLRVKPAQFSVVPKFGGLSEFTG